MIIGLRFVLHPGSMIVTVLKPSPKSLTNWADQEALGTQENTVAAHIVNIKWMTSQGIRRARNSVQVHALPFQIRSSATLMVTKRPARHRHPTSKLGVGAENLGGFRTVNNVVVQFMRVSIATLQAVRLSELAQSGVKKMPYPTSGRRPIKNGIA